MMHFFMVYVIFWRLWVKKVSKNSGKRIFYSRQLKDIFFSVDYSAMVKK